MTDPEVVEWRFPVRIDEFSIRKNSGGKGKYSGGDGVVRKIRFLEKMTATILSSHRQEVPYGLAGGQPGETGSNSVLRHSGEMETRAGNDEVTMAPGDVFCIETPGGGGFGTPTNQ
jgi:5-oxoprolinase (ATP-hydrolysing)